MHAIRSIISAVVLSALSQVALAAPMLVTGVLSETDPLYNRPLSGNPPTMLSGVGTAVYYDVFSFHVTTNGNYVMKTVDAAFADPVGFISNDTFITLYQTGFDPASPLANALIADDDSGAGQLSSITRSLNAGTDYFLVVTSYSNYTVGSYSATFDSAVGTNGQVVLGLNNVPEPVSLALVGLGLASLCLRKRNKA